MARRGAATSLPLALEERECQLQRGARLCVVDVELQRYPRFRRYWVSDRVVQPELADKVRQWDVTNGLPPLPRWKDIALVYLDPPYWKQAEGKYSKDPTDLANMPLDQFNDTLARLIKGFLKKIPTGARVALLMQPTQWKAPEHEYTDHIIEMTRRVGLPEMRISCPYESQQYTPQMVDWAKDNKQFLVLTREMIVWNAQ